MPNAEEGELPGPARSPPKSTRSARPPHPGPGVCQVESHLVLVCPSPPDGRLQVIRPSQVWAARGGQAQLRTRGERILVLYRLGPWDGEKKGVEQARRVGLDRGGPPGRAGQAVFNGPLRRAQGPLQPAKRKGRVPAAKSRRPRLGQGEEVGATWPPLQPKVQTSLSTPAEV